MTQVPQMQYISRDDKRFTHAQQAEIMFRNGIKWVQIRMKNSSDDEIKQQAAEAMEYAKKYNGVLIINDSIAIAQAVKAHGIHLGLNDTSIEEARQQLGNDCIIGGTANTEEQIRLQIARGADYVGVGPFRFTTTKKNLSPIVGLSGYEALCKQCNDITVPLVAVGGIEMVDMDEILNTGISGVAMSAALLSHILEKEKK